MQVVGRDTAATREPAPVAAEAVGIAPAASVRGTGKPIPTRAGVVGMMTVMAVVMVVMVLAVMGVVAVLAVMGVLTVMGVMGVMAAVAVVMDVGMAHGMALTMYLKI
ncbi:Uncharacterised protein [Achromobacter kerstersii]|nr:Uncharacterised protein [Achromobacter kerstersii]